MRLFDVSFLSGTRTFLIFFKFNTKLHERLLSQQCASDIQSRISFFSKSWLKHHIQNKPKDFFSSLDSGFIDLNYAENSRKFDEIYSTAFFTRLSEKF